MRRQPSSTLWRLTARKYSSALKLQGTAIREQADEFGYLFVDRPPYEVMASKTISYAEMLRLLH